MTTTFVSMYHPLLPSTITEPARVAEQAVDERAAQGWLLVDPDAVLPEPSTPYYTKEALLSQIQGGASPIGTALRAAFVARVTPEQFGAKGDGASRFDGAMTSGSAVLTAGGASFTAADVGKRILVIGAGAAGGDLATTIASRSSGTSVTLAAPAGTTVAAATITYGTDDTAAIQACVDAVITAGGGWVDFGPHTYTVAQPPRTDRVGNSVVALGKQATGNFLGFRGAWPQENTARAFSVNSMGGARIEYIGPNNLAYSGTYGPPSILGGPTEEQSGHRAYSFQHVVVEDLEVCAPPNPSLGGIDLRLITRVGLDRVQVTINSDQGTFAQPTRVHSCGLRLPTAANFSKVILGSVVVGGYYCLVAANTEHFVATDLVLHRGHLGLSFESDDGWHGSSITMLQTEHLRYHVGSWRPDAGLVSLTGLVPLHIANWDIEDHDPAVSPTWMTTQQHVYDPANQLRGVVNYIRASAPEGIRTGSDGALIRTGGDGLSYRNLADLPGSGGSGTLVEDAANGHTGILSGTAKPTLVASPFSGYGNALFFPGSGADEAAASKVDFGADWLGSSHTALTIDARIRLAAGSSGDREVISKWGTGAGGGNFFVLAVGADDKLLIAFTAIGGGTVYITDPGALADETNYVVRAVWNGTNLSLYRDGTRVATTALGAIEEPDFTTPLYVGAQASATPGPFQGIIDEVRISTVARTAPTATSYTVETTPFTDDADTLLLVHCDALV